MLTRSIRALAAVGIAASSIGGCSSIATIGTVNSQGLYANPVVRAPVTTNTTPYSAALVCLQQYARRNGLSSPRIAVGRIDDLTGKAEPDGSGRQITMGASLMAMTAFGKAGANMTERYDTSVAEMELKYANAKLIGDGAPTPGQPADYRKIYAGQVQGSDFYITGGITELNANIRSNGTDLQVGQNRTSGYHGRIGGRTFVMNVAMDLRVVDSISLQVVDVIGYQKQIVAQEAGGGYFDILGNHLFDLSTGSSYLEPKQVAVRSLVERSVVEIMANFYGMPGPQACMDRDPYGFVRTAGGSGSFVPAYDNLGTNNAQTREDPNRWNSNRDADVPPLRGRSY